MRRIVTTHLAGAVLALALAALAPAAPARAALPIAAAQQVDLPALIDRLMPTVVSINIVKQATMPTAEQKAAERRAAGTAAAASMISRKKAVGSGFIVDPSGVIVTNKHVVEGAIEIFVTLHDGRQLPAQLLSAAILDLALLKVDAPDSLPVVTWGDSDALRQGMSVLAIGNPLGYGGTVTSGIVSALDRDLRSSAADAYIQTDAPINPGNSGGPLFDLKGEVVGVNTALVTTDGTGGSIGIGFSIPSNDVRFTIARLMKYGRLRPGWLPLDVQPVSQAIAQALGLKDRGVIVTGYETDRPALADRVRPGDVLLQVAGARVTDRRGFVRALAAVDIGEAIPLTVWRDGATRTVEVTVEDNPYDEKQAKAMTLADMALGYVSPPDLGLRLAALTPAARGAAKLSPSQKGVLVTGVSSDSRAAEQGVEAGDVIVAVEDRPVASAAELWDQIKHQRMGRATRMLLLVYGPKGKRWVVLPTA